MPVIRLKETNGTCVVGPSGSIDVEEAEAIVVAIRNLALGGKKSFVVDLGRVVCPDYRGLSLLMRGIKQFMNGETSVRFSGANEYSANLLSLIDPASGQMLVESPDGSNGMKSRELARKQAG